VEKIQPTTLTGVSETALWTLWNRSLEASRPDALFDDPVAIDLVDRIDYPYRERFGLPQQAFVIRALAYDSVVRGYLRAQPAGAVVALGEGLQTSYWRLGRPQSPWITVDLAPVITLRERLLPVETQVVNIARSVLDRSWMDEVPTGVPPLITAEGLFMYFDEPTVFALIYDCAARFPGGRMVFDAVPQWWRRKKNKTIGATPDALIVPPMLSSISAKAAARLPDRVGGVTAARAVPIPRGRGLAGQVQRMFYRGWFIPGQWRGSLHELRFAAPSSAS
jgi:O-methyltransferase involved in polyketide biosynthesis